MVNPHLRCLADAIQRLSRSLARGLARSLSLPRPFHIKDACEDYGHRSTGLPALFPRQFASDTDGAYIAMVQVFPQLCLNAASPLLKTICPRIIYSQQD